MREIDVVAPVQRRAGRTAARSLARPTPSRPRRRARPGAWPAARTGGPAAAAAVATGLLVALGLVGVGYAVGLARQLTPHIPVLVRAAARRVAGGPPPGQRRGRGYWQSTAVTLDQRRQGPDPAGRHRLPAAPADAGQGASGRTTPGGTTRPTNTADFVVLAPGNGEFSGFTDRAAVIATFGEPTRTYHFEQYTILVWPHDEPAHRARGAATAARLALFCGACAALGRLTGIGRPRSRRMFLFQTRIV